MSQVWLRLLYLPREINSSDAVARHNDQSYHRDANLASIKILCPSVEDFKKYTQCGGRHVQPAFFTKRKQLPSSPSTLYRHFHQEKPYTLSIR